MAPTTTEINTLSLHDALPIYAARIARRQRFGNLLERFEGECAEQRAYFGGAELGPAAGNGLVERGERIAHDQRSEEHTSELQSRRDRVCRLLLEKKNNNPALL